MLLTSKICTADVLVWNKQRGFLLLEVLLALTILSGGIIAVVKAYSLSLKAQRHAQYQTSAFLLASKLQEEIEANIIGELNGEELLEMGLFEWSVETEPVYLESSYNEKFELVTVKVRWKERLKEYVVSLSNLYPEGFVEEVVTEKNRY
jgi:hypothetical protein